MKSTLSRRRSASLSGPEPPECPVCDGPTTAADRGFLHCHDCECSWKLETDTRRRTEADRGATRETVGDPEKGGDIPIEVAAVPGHILCPICDDPRPYAVGKLATCPDCEIKFRYLPSHEYATSAGLDTALAWQIIQKYHAFTFNGSPVAVEAYPFQGGGSR